MNGRITLFGVDSFAQKYSAIERTRSKLVPYALLEGTYAKCKFFKYSGFVPY